MRKSYMSLKQFASVIILFATLISCRKLVTGNLPDMDSQIVVNSLFCANEKIKLHLSLTGGFDSTELADLNNALVILKEDNSIKDTLKSIGNGFYQSSFEPVQNHKYSCQVNYKNYNTLIGITELPPQQEIIEYEHINYAGKDEEGVIYPAVNLKFTNDASIILYYEIIIKLIVDNRDYIWNEEPKRWDEVPDTILTIPELINITTPALLSNGLPIAVFSNELIKDKQHTITLNYKTGSYYSDNTGHYTDLHPLVVELRTISYEYFRFVNQLYLYEQGRYPTVFGDVARIFPLYSNIENGYGIFAGYTKCITDTIYPF